MSGWVARVSRVKTGFAVLVALIAVAGCGSSDSGGSKASDAADTTQVQDHVHGVVAGAKDGSLLVATHYGLETSTDGGRTWTSDGGLGDEMVAGLVKTPSRYVASLQMMPGMSMPSLGSGGASMAGMSMSGSSTNATSMPDIAYSADGHTWSMPKGLPADVQVTSMAQGPSSGTIWAALLGRGIYQSQDGGAAWTEAIPASVPINTIAVVGDNLLLATPSGLFVTGTGGPSMPALAQLQGAINDIAAIPGCVGCVVASLGTHTIAVSHTDGVSWKRYPSPTTFDVLYATKGALFGMAPSASDPHRGVWRSTNDGKSWTRTLNAPLVDHLYQQSPTRLLAFEWGIKVFASTNDGRTWTLQSRISPK